MGVAGSSSVWSIIRTRTRPKLKLFRFPCLCPLMKSSLPQCTTARCFLRLGPSSGSILIRSTLMVDTNHKLLKCSYSEQQHTETPKTFWRKAVKEKLLKMNVFNRKDESFLGKTKKVQRTNLLTFCSSLSSLNFAFSKNFDIAYTY